MAGEKGYRLAYQIFKPNLTEPMSQGEFKDLDYDDVLEVQEVVMDGLKKLGQKKSQEKKQGKK